MRRVTAFMRGALVTVLVWAPLGAVTWLTMRVLTQRGSVSAAADVSAMRMGAFAFVAFIAGVLGSLVAGRALVDDYEPQALVTFVLAALTPLPIAAATIAFGHATDNGDAATWAALVAAVLVGGTGGGFVAALRERDAEDSYSERMSRHNVATSQGWRRA